MGPLGCVPAEKILFQLLEKYGVHWAEPSNRLATLYYMTGNLKASEAICMIVLAVKPWHFGALSGLVMIYASMNDSMNARLWSTRRLPSYAPTTTTSSSATPESRDIVMGDMTSNDMNSINKRREQWVDAAIESAKERLQQAEERLNHSFGDRDEHVVDDENTSTTDMGRRDKKTNSVSNIMINDENKDDVWQ